MMKRTNRLIIVPIVIITYAFFGCSANNDPVKLEPTIDFKATADISNDADKFNQVLLRIQLLNSKSDILKFGITTPEEHQIRLNYYRVDFKHDLFLISKGDTIPCYDLHAERLYMDLPFMNFIATFNHPIHTGDEILVKDIVYTNQAAVITIEQNEENQ